jgi:hypothetical protein
MSSFSEGRPELTPVGRICDATLEHITQGDLDGVDPDHPGLAHGVVRGSGYPHC